MAQSADTLNLDSGSFQAMYLDHFGLSQPPFKITPNTEFFYAGGSRGAILNALLYAIIHGEGIVKVTGEIGSGKTMLCRMLESMLPDNIEAIYLANPSLSRDEVFHAIAGELGLATGGKRGGEIMSQMQACLIEKHSTGKQVVLLVEEAQAMPLDTLEEIRLLSNLETSHHKLLQIVLFGQPELDENLGLPRMRQLKERITHSFTVPPLTQADIPEYLMFRMRAAGYHGPDIFGTGAIKRIASASQGITRRINVLADKALLAAFSLNTHNILPKHIKAAIEDSEFAAAPHRLPLKQIGFAATLLGLGIALGAGWHLARLPLERSAAATAVQTAHTLAIHRPAQETSAQAPTEPTPALTADTEQGLRPKLSTTLSWSGSQEETHSEVAKLAVPPGNPPMKQIGLAAALLGLGIALGAGWRRLVRPRFKTDATMPTVQPTPAHPIPPPFQVATEQKSTELAPIQTTDTEQMPQQNGSTEPPSESAPAAEHDPLQSSLDTAQPSPADKEDEQLAHPRLKAEAATPLIQAASPPAAQTSIHEPSALDPLQQRLAATQKWLNNEDDTHFTIQLILLADTGAEPQLESVLSRLDREIGLTQIFVYPTRNAAGHQFGIAFGNFSSREQALAALATLPTDYRKSRLALRTVMGIRGEIAEQQII